MLDYDRYWDQVRRDKALMDDLDEAHAKLDAAEARADAATAERDAAVEKLRQDKFQTARKMKAKGFSTEDITELTGLATDEIERL